MTSEDDVSKVLFHNPSFLPIAWAVLQSDHEFRPRDLSGIAQRPCSPNVLQRLIRLELIEKQDEPKGSYRILDDPLWRAIETSRIAVNRIERPKTPKWQPIRPPITEEFWASQDAVVLWLGDLITIPLKLKLLLWLSARSKPGFRYGDYWEETLERSQANPWKHLPFFEQLGMIRCLDPELEPKSPKQPRYRRLPSPLWQIGQSLLEYLDDVDLRPNLRVPGGLKLQLHKPILPSLDDQEGPVEAVATAADKKRHYAAREERFVPVVVDGVFRNGEPIRGISDQTLCDELVEKIIPEGASTALKTCRLCNIKAEITPAALAQHELEWHIKAVERLEEANRLGVLVGYQEALSQRLRMGQWYVMTQGDKVSAVQLCNNGELMLVFGSPVWRCWRTSYQYATLILEYWFEGMHKDWAKRHLSPMGRSWA